MKKKYILTNEQTGIVKASFELKRVLFEFPRYKVTEIRTEFYRAEQQGLNTIEFGYSGANYTLSFIEVSSDIGTQLKLF